MRRSITSAITLAVSVILLSLVSSDSTTQAQLRGKLFHWDTGIVALGPNQVLRITGDWNGDGDTTVAFTEIRYFQGACNPVCKLDIVGTTTSGPHTVAAGEGISYNLVATTYGRSTVTSNRRDVQLTASIINTLTGETTSHIIMANTEGDFH